ncbi:MAG: hypothetical protein KME35_05560 [Aphanocapsa sp. GSE-SYN-MK-11-07L]|jgi:hypothetical protein|nr:hypothetical protein [Aphanocapsa sp. GSE-SYN-MK-11-07L]
MKQVFLISLGALLSAGLSILEPAQAMVITVDDYSTDQDVNRLRIGTSTGSVDPNDGSILDNASRDVTLNVTNAGTGNTSAGFTTPSIISNAAGFSLPTGYTGNFRLSYDFTTSPQDLTSGGTNNRFSFSVIDSDATPNRTITFGISLNGAPTVNRVLTSDVDFGIDPAIPITFDFSSFASADLVAATSLQLVILSSQARDVTITPLQAVPVPPALLGTLFAGVLAAIKAKRKSELAAGSKA